MSNYAKRMARLSARIFGEVVRQTDQQSMKVVSLMSEKPVHLNKDIVDYYPRHNEMYWLMRKIHFYGLYRDEHQDFIEEMIKQRALKGKSKPKKGEGKRALKRKA